MNNKDQLQQELLKKVKPGIKPSDLKKINHEERKHLDHVLTSPHNIPVPPPPPPKPTQENNSPPPMVQPEPKPEAKIKPVLCSTCHTYTNKPRLIKVAASDPQYNLQRGQQYPFCSSCAPKIKEYNEYDLITPELWQKYPYSSASEILELEFGLRKEEP